MADRTWDDVIASMREDLINQIKFAVDGDLEMVNDEIIQGAVDQVANVNLPVYTNDIISVLVSNFNNIGFRIIDPGLLDEVNVVNVATYSVYEALREAAYDLIEGVKEELEI